MTEHIFESLASELRHVTGHFRHPGHTISSGPTQPASTLEPVMPLADTSADLASTSTALKTSLDDAQASHARLEQLLGDVAAVAQIADHPLVVAAAGALHVPPPVLDGFISGLVALAKAFPHQEQAPAPAAPVEPMPDVDPAVE